MPFLLHSTLLSEPTAPDTPLPGLCFLSNHLMSGVFLFTATNPSSKPNTDNHPGSSQQISHPSGEPPSPDPSKKGKPYPRKFQRSWKQQYSWLEYREDVDAVFCSVCTKALNADLLHAQTRTEDTFTQKGFRNWKKGTERLKRHEKSDCHRHATQKVAALKLPCMSEVMNMRVSQDHLIAQKALLLMFSCIGYLGEQGFPLRGRDHDDGAFVTS